MLLRFLPLIFVLSIFSAPSKAAISKKINSGDTIYGLLQKNRFSSAQINNILAKGVVPKKFTLVPGKHYGVKKENNRTEVKFFQIDTDYVFIFWKQGKKSGVERKPAEYRVKVETINGKVYGSLISSINKHTSDKLLAYRFMDAFAFDYNLRRQLQPGDKFSITFEKKYDGKRFIKVGEILKAELNITGKKVTRHFVKHKGGGSFIDPNFNQDNRPFYAPTNYSSFSSHFTYRRKHPVTGRVKAHLGLDYELPVNSPIYSVYAGKVLRKGKNRAAGNYVVIRHPNGLESYYNHLSSINKKIRKGGYVKSGQLLGKNGCTGYCTKPHLHFAVKKNGKWVNPIKYVRSYPYHQRKKIKKSLARLVAQNN